MKIFHVRSRLEAKITSYFPKLLEDFVTKQNGSYWVFTLRSNVMMRGRDNISLDHFLCAGVGVGVSGVNVRSLSGGEKLNKSSPSHYAAT